MTRGRLAIHAHFYQPERRDPFGGPTPPDPTAAPYAGWTERVIAECYRPNVELGNLARISFNIGPTLTAALAAEDPATLARITGRHAANAFAQGFHHAILPLGSGRDRRTEIRWGLRDHHVRFGRPAAGFWLPETAADLPTLRTLVEEGVQHAVLAPWQVADPGIEIHRPYRVDVGAAGSLVVMFYDADLSGAISFRPDVTADADRFAREWVLPRTSTGVPRDGAGSRRTGRPLVLIATDGELYGHHQRFRDLFLQRLVDPAIDRGFDVVTLGEALGGLDPASLPTVRIDERTSWSCHHGILRWSA
ncbi:MAG: glycoside hydrolase, partial [Chloroflexi bacterium]|nr:glycoside hydrolase [Chloroflexota bacterium]